MIRKIVEINEEKCTGCQLCISACHEGALQLVNGKARLISDAYCDGLGDCLPACPADAISIIERNAVVFDEEAVKKQIEAKNSLSEPSSCGCPGSAVTVLDRSGRETGEENCSCHSEVKVESQLSQWPCQIKLVSIDAPFLNNADLLIAADCSAYAYANFHQDFMQNRITLIGCPKLDNVDYTTKLTEMFKLHEINSIKVVRMSVPCCGSLVNNVNQAVLNSNKNIAVNTITVDTAGRLVSD